MRILSYLIFVCQCLFFLSYLSAYMSACPLCYLYVSVISCSDIIFQFIWMPDLFLSFCFRESLFSIFLLCELLLLYYLYISLILLGQTESVQDQTSVRCFLLHHPNVHMMKVWTWNARKYDQLLWQGQKKKTFFMGTKFSAGLFDSLLHIKVILMMMTLMELIFVLCVAVCCCWGCCMIEPVQRSDIKK